MKNRNRQLRGDTMADQRVSQLVYRAQALAREASEDRLGDTLTVLVTAVLQGDQVTAEGALRRKDQTLPERRARLARLRMVCSEARDPRLLDTVTEADADALQAAATMCDRAARKSTAWSLGAEYAHLRQPLEAFLDGSEGQSIAHQLEALVRLLMPAGGTGGTGGAPALRGR